MRCIDEGRGSESNEGWRIWWRWQYSNCCAENINREVSTRAVMSQCRCHKQNTCRTYLAKFGCGLQIPFQATQSRIVVLEINTVWSPTAALQFCHTRRRMAIGGLGKRNVALDIGLIQALVLRVGNWAVGLMRRIGLAEVAKARGSEVNVVGLVGHSGR